MKKRLDVLGASKRISKHVRQTYLSYSSSFSNNLNNHVWFKLENLQYTGSFKVRGAFNKLLTDIFIRLSVSPQIRIKQIIALFCQRDYRIYTLKKLRILK